MWPKSHTKTYIFIILAVFSALIGLTVPSSVAHADPIPTKASQMPPSEGAVSWVYYNALSACANGSLLSTTSMTINGLMNNRIKQADAISGNWFEDGYALIPGLAATRPNIGLFLSVAVTGVKTNQHYVTCGGDYSGWIIDAVKTRWGYADGVDALCDFGAQRVTAPQSKDCRNNTGQWDFKGNLDNQGTETQLDYKKIQKAIKVKIYGNSEPVLSADQKYVLYLDAFKAGCLGSANPPVYNGPAPVSDQYLYTLMIVGADGHSIAPIKYYGILGASEKIALYTTVQDGNVTKTCKEVMDTINSNATSYQVAAAKFFKATGIADGAKASSTTATNTNSCGSAVVGTGWILCPILASLTAMNDAMWTMVQGLLTINPLQQGDAIYLAWNSIRSLANIVFVIFFLFITLSQLTGFGITNYGIKKLLPRLIICAILVNVSYILIQVSVDLSNILGKGLYELIVGMAPQITADWTGLVADVVGTVGVAGAGVAAAALLGGAGSILWMILPMAVMAALGLFTAILTLAFRQAAIPILAILAPFALVAYLLPNTEQWFKKWKDLLLPMLMLYPLAAAVFAGAVFSSNILYQQGGWWFHLLALIILAMPLFSLPFLARSGGSILSSVGGALNKMAEKARAPISNVSKDFGEAAKAKYLADDPEKRSRFRNSRVGKAFDRSPFGSVRRGSQFIAGRKINREMEKETDTKEFKSKVGRNRIAGVDGAAAIQRSINRGVHDQADVEEDKSLHARSNTGAAAIDRLAKAKEETHNDENQAAIRQVTGARGADMRALKIANANLDKDVTHENKTITSDASRTREGRRLDEQAVADETIAATDKQRATGRVDSDPTRLDIIQEAAEAENYTKSVQDQSQQLTKEGSTEAGATALEAAFLPNYVPGNPVDEAEADAARQQAARLGQGLQYTQRTSDVAASATQAAQRKVSQEYEKAVAPVEDVLYTDTAGNPLLDLLGNTIPTGDKVIPVTDTAVKATGIGGSTDLIQALQVQAGDKRQADEATAARVMVEATADTAGKIKAASTELESILTSTAPDAKDTEVAERTAISTTQTLGNTGNPGRVSLRKQTARLPKGDISKVAAAVRSTTKTLNLKSSSASLDRHSYDKDYKSLGEIMTEAKTYIDLTQGELVSQDTIDLQAAWACGAISPVFAQSIVAHPDSYKEVNGERMQIFAAVAAAATAGLPLVPDPTERARIRASILTDTGVDIH